MGSKVESRSNSWIKVGPGRVRDEHGSRGRLGRRCEQEKQWDEGGTRGTVDEGEGRSSSGMNVGAGEHWDESMRRSRSGKRV